MQMRTIVFLEHDRKVLDGLQRVLRPMRRVWNIHFMNSSRAAKDVFKKEDVDMVLADFSDEADDGAEFLEMISRERPDVIRIVFASHISEKRARKALGSSHQIILKPIDAEALKARIMRMLTLRDLLEGSTLRKLIGQLRSIPSLPFFYREIMVELKKPDASLKAVGEIIAKDIAMTAKILQLVNSPFFGFFKHVSNPVQAVSLLGLDTVRDISLTLHIFKCFEDVHGVISYPRLWEHSMKVASLAKRIALLETDDAEIGDQAFIAGLLHDVGKLILAVDFPEIYQDFIKKAKEKDIYFVDLEQQTFRATHAELAAYLLSMWGLPDRIVEAVAFHHRPSAANVMEFSPLVAVHVANWMRNKTEDNFLGAMTPVDMKMLKNLKLNRRLRKWEALSTQ